MATSKTTKKTPNKTVKKSTTAKSAPKKMDMTEEMSAPATRKPNKNLMIIVVIGLILAGLYYMRGQFIVAIVNGRPITRLEVLSELENQAGKGTTDILISQKLIEMEAQNQGVVVEQSEIDDRIKAIEDDVKSSGQSLDELLELQGVTREDIEKQTRLQLQLRKLLEDKIGVTDEEVDEAFEQQTEAKPEDMSDEEFKTQIRSSIEEQKFAFEAQSFVQELQSKADIQYWLEY